LQSRLDGICESIRIIEMRGSVRVVIFERSYSFQRAFPWEIFEFTFFDPRGELAFPCMMYRTPNFFIENTADALKSGSE
jgi:hypothetical protein